MFNNFDIMEDKYFYDKTLEKRLKHNDKDLSFFDCLYMAIMDQELMRYLHLISILEIKKILRQHINTSAVNYVDAPIMDAELDTAQIQYFFFNLFFYN